MDNTLDRLKKQSLITSFFSNSNTEIPFNKDLNPISNTIEPTKLITNEFIKSLNDDKDFNEKNLNDDKSINDIQFGNVKRRIIDDDEVIDNYRQDESMNYSTTNYVTENNLWDSSNSEPEEGYDSGVIFDLSKLKYSESMDMDIKNPTILDIKSRDVKDFTDINQERNYYLSCHASKVSKMFRDYIENYYLYYESFIFPPWIQPRYIKDSSGRRPDSIDYNPSTILIPHQGHRWINEYRSTHYTPTMKQYWSIKSNHFDKIIFFKMGRFYEIFYIDACISHQICDLRWMGKESKPHIGFPEQSLKYYASKLVNLGYKVVVVEQMETPKEMIQKTKNMKFSEKIISREICQILSKGTLSHSNLLTHDSQPLLSIVFDTNLNELIASNGVSNELISSNGVSNEASNDKTYNFGICLIDVSTNRMSISYHNDDESRLSLKTILLRANPAEILYIPNNVSKSIIDIFNRLPMRPQLSHCDIRIDEYKNIDENIKSILNSSLVSNEGRNLILKSINLACEYLYEMQLENVIKSSNITISDQYLTDKLKLNSYVYDHLEIFNTSLGEAKNSFFNFINNTSTPFGSRLLRSWITSPSTDLTVINSRLDTVEWLIDNPLINKEIRRILSTCIDLERQIGSMTSNNKRAIKFDHIQSNKLLSFYKLLKGFEPFENLRCLTCNLSSDYLSFLLKSENDGGSYPSLKPYKTYFLDKLQIVDKQCYPQKGVYDKFDKLSEKIEFVISELNNELDNLSNALNTNLIFVHAKFKYEIECPESYQRRVSKYEITSTRKGYVRFRTPKISSLVDELQDMEFERWELTGEYFTILLQEFKKYIPEFTKAINIMAEIDCLSTFAYNVLSNTSYIMCKPKLHPMQGKPFLRLEESIHPIIGLNIPNFVSNNIYMNYRDESNICLLLTGPNMGGKSTLLRQICLCIIMSQIGSYVPARIFESTIVDRIFTRLGAYDSIMEGKSTFFIELEETSIMMNQASVYSLCMIDELGRGTSTFDGMAIASSSLLYIANTICCRCIFSTHYHLICEEARMVDTISLYYMLSMVKDNELKLLYQFTRGESLKSQGLHVAKLAGIPESVLEVAQTISNSMESKLNNSNVKILSECLNLLKIGDLNALEKIFNNFKI